MEEDKGGLTSSQRVCNIRLSLDAAVAAGAGADVDADAVAGVPAGA